MRLVRVQGAMPDDLVAIRVSNALVPAFVLEARFDSVGRASSAGGIIAAMFGLGPQAELRIPATEFMLPVHGFQAQVQLNLRGSGASGIEAIRVQVDVG